MAEITSNDYFTLDGVSSATVGIYVDTPPIPPLAKQRYTTWKTGIDMDNASPDDVFENITISFSCFVFFKSTNFDLSAIYAFLQGKTTLQYSRFADRYFKIRQIGGLTPQQQYDGNKFKFTVSFVCAPFKYHTSNSAVTPSGTIENPGTRYSRPVYAITHSGACKLTVNGEELQIAAGAASPIYIDAERMIAYDGTGANQTKYTTGNFPFLVPGVNTISTTGSLVSVTGNWRDY